MNRLRVATASTPITERDGPTQCCSAGEVPCRRGEAIHCAVIDADVRLAIISCGSVALGRSTHERAAGDIFARYGIPKANILIAAAPAHWPALPKSELPKKGQACLEDAIRRSVEQALLALEEHSSTPNVVEAEMGVASSVDSDTTVIAFLRPTGQPAAVLLSEAAGNAGPGSSAFFGLTKVVALPADDAACLSQPVAKALGSLRHGLRGPVCSLKEKALVEVAGRVHSTWLQVIVLGDVALACVPGRLASGLGRKLRQSSPFAHTAVVCYANDFIGDIPCESEALVTQVAGLLRRAHRKAGVELHASGGSWQAVIRPLRSDDALRLQLFYNQLGTPARRLFRPLGWNTTFTGAQEVVDGATGGKRYDLVVESGGCIAGWAFLAAMDKEDTGLGIGIAEGYQGKGFGKRLMSALIEEAARQQKRSINLIVVRDNQRAQGLYKQFGFEMVGTETGKDELDYYRMRLTLADPEIQRK